MTTPTDRQARRRPLSGWLALAGVAFLAGMAGRVRGEVPATPATRDRQPAALAVGRGGDWLYVANGKSGSVSVIDTLAARVVAEHDVGRGLADLAPLPDGRRLLAVDRAGSALIVLDVEGASVRVAARLTVADDPVAVAVAPDGASCVVASLWSRRLTFVDLNPASVDGQRRPVVAGTLDLPFSPRNLVAVGAGSHFVVGDAFGGKLAVVEAARRSLGPVRTLAAHNVRGLAVTPDGRSLVVAHQVLRRAAKSDYEDVHWGRLLTSHLLSLRVDAVLATGTDEDLLRGSCQIDLGSATEGAGDPSALLCDRSGLVAVALGGVDQVALGRSPSGYFRRYGVGTRPTALAASPDGKTLYVADTFDDSVSAVEAGTGRRAGVISLGPRPAPSLAGMGARWFYDARLSHDGWMSCHSCHTDGHSNGLLGDTLGDGSYGAPKRVPSLLGTGPTAPWSWDGSSARLEDQVRASITTTMRGPSPTSNQVAALTAYLRTLTPPAPVSTGLPEAVERGRVVFLARGCVECHAPPAYTSTGRYDVGLADESGHREFNPPSLRAVGRREPLLHDGRAATLEDVFLKHRHPTGDEPMARDEVADLVAFLRSL